MTNPTTPAKADPGARVMTQSGGANTMTNQPDQGVTIDPRIERLIFVTEEEEFLSNNGISDALRYQHERDALARELTAALAQPAPPVPGVEPNSNESIPDVIGRALFDWLKELIDAGEWNPTSGELDAIIQHLTDKVSVFVWEREQ